MSMELEKRSAAALAEEYETIIGLEVHAELKTASKIFCPCSTSFGAPPNTQCCPVCMGFPGAMPSLNRRVVELAVKAGLALNCEIFPTSSMDRKQYFYPDLPKGYQITQNGCPICQNGYLEIRCKDGKRRIGIAEIHMEEDAGKLIHSGSETLVDCNRCGVPLIEVVSCPDLRSGSEAAAYLRALRGILLACGISDCRMQEGSLRCDVNVSVRPRGEELFGVRCEIKNLNSFLFVEKAIQYEIERQTSILKQGGKLIPETRRYDERSGETVVMRKKERGVDYRYLPEPDLPFVKISPPEIKRIAASLPELPDARAERLERKFGLQAGDGALLVSEPALADYFECAAKASERPVSVFHLLRNDLFPHCSWDPFVAPVAPQRLGQLATLFGGGRINSATAKKLLARMIKEDLDPAVVMEREGLEQIRDEKALLALAKVALESAPRAAADYRSGKKAALKALQGKAMALAGGRADPILLESILCSLLKEGGEG